jgi:ABC-2 type transport system permease protein
VPGVMTVILMLVSAMMTSISITVKRTGYHGSIARLPFKPLQVILGKVFPYIFLSMINATVIVVLGVLFRNAHRGKYILLAFESILFIITALSLGILISTISNSQQTAMMIS